MQYVTVIIVVLFSVSSSAAFNGYTNKLAFQRRTLGSRAALIFSSDGERFDEIESVESSLCINKYARMSSPCDQLAESISKNFVASLARLAVAFSPPDRALRLKNIEKVQVLDMDEKHLDIEAVLCENEECITLSVPVSFPSPCNAGSSLDSLSECIYDNINALDFEATRMVEKFRHDMDNFEAYRAEERRYNDLSRSHDFELPHWWVNPIGELIAECEFLKKLLNEDEFSKDLRGLACRTMSAVLGEDFDVQQAAVAVIGPAGLVIRANYADEILLGKTTSDLETAELPISFQTAARNPGELRELVLRTVET
jgi:hypothetical protein